MNYYRLYEITDTKIEQFNDGQEIKDAELCYHLDIPEDKIDDESFINDRVSSINQFFDGSEHHHFVVVKTDKDFNYLDCVHVFFPYTHFLDCVDWNHRAICEFYFRKNKLL